MIVDVIVPLTKNRSLYRNDKQKYRQGTNVPRIVGCQEQVIGKEQYLLFSKQRE